MHVSLVSVAFACGHFCKPVNCSRGCFHAYSVPELTRGLYVGAPSRSSPPASTSELPRGLRHRAPTWSPCQIFHVVSASELLHGLWVRAPLCSPCLSPMSESHAPAVIAALLMRPILQGAEPRAPEWSPHWIVSAYAAAFPFITCITSELHVVLRDVTFTLSRQHPNTSAKLDVTTDM